MAKITVKERQAVLDYRDTVVGLSQRLRESMARVGAMFPATEENFDNSAWCEALIAEARSWRQVLDAMPAEPPQRARGVHTRTLRWFALAAEAGDDMAIGVQTSDPERLSLGVSKLPEVTTLSSEAARSAKFLAEQMR